MIKMIWAYIFRWPLVWTRDFDGQVRLRRVIVAPWKERTAAGIFINRGILCSDGTIRGHGYMTHWKAANKQATHLFE